MGRLPSSQVDLSPGGQPRAKRALVPRLSISGPKRSMHLRDESRVKKPRTKGPGDRCAARGIPLPNGNQNPAPAVARSNLCVSASDQHYGRPG